MGRVSCLRFDPERGRLCGHVRGNFGYGDHGAEPGCPDSRGVCAGRRFFNAGPSLDRGKQRSRTVHVRGDSRYRNPGTRRVPAVAAPARNELYRHSGPVPGLVLDVLQPRPAGVDAGVCQPVLCHLRHCSADHAATGWRTSGLGGDPGGAGVRQCRGLFPRSLRHDSGSE